MPTNPPISPLEAVPTPDRIRDRLTQISRERELLKKLLRLSQRKQQVLPVIGHPLTLEVAHAR